MVINIVCCLIKQDNKLENTKLKFVLILNCDKNIYLKGNKLICRKRKEYKRVMHKY